MINRINLNDSEWCNIVFEGRNKAYGAYYHRTKDDRRVVLAFFLAIVLFGGVSSAFLIKDNLIGKGLPDHNGYVNFTPVDIPQPIEKPIELPVYEPARALKPSIQLNNQLMIRDDVEESTMATHEAMMNPNIRIGATTVIGDEPMEKEWADDHYRPTGDTKAIHLVVDQAPEYEGGMAALQELLQKNLRYPESARMDGIAGKVYVQFVVGASGEVETIKILRGVGAGCDEEAIRVVKLMKKWKPAKLDGHAVRAYFNLPINFSME